MPNRNLIATRAYKTVTRAPDDVSVTRNFVPVAANDNYAPSPPHNSAATTPAATVRFGDCMDVLKRLPASSFDAVVTDPPYARNKLLPNDYRNMLAAFLADEDVSVRPRKGIDGMNWDGDVPGPKVWKAVARVLKPGGYLAAFMSEEKLDLLVTALRLAGFDIMHVMPWIKGPGHETLVDLSKPVQKEIKFLANDNSPDEVLGYKPVMDTTGILRRKGERLAGTEMRLVPIIEITEPGAIPWVGAKQSLNHAHEFIVIACKPISESSRAKNIVRHGTGGMAVGALGKNGRMASTLDASFAPDIPTSVRAGRTRRALSNRYMDEGVDNPHPCTKPLELMQWLVKLLCPKGGRVLDPFLGSGTTALAAMLEGRDCEGIERDNRFADVSAMRIRNCRAEIEGEPPETAIKAPLRIEPVAKAAERVRRVPASHTPDDKMDRVMDLHEQGRHTEARNLLLGQAERP